MFLNRQQFANLKHGKCSAPDNPGSNGGEQVDPGIEEQDAGSEQKKEPEEPERKYTDEEVNGIVSKRIAREREKLEKEIREQVKKESEAKKSEAKKLEEMTELERARYEAEQLRAEKAKLESKIDFDAQMAFARKELAGKGINLSDDLLGMIVSDDGEKTKGNIEQFAELFNKAKDTAVQEALKRNPPFAEPNPSEKSYGAKFAEEYSKKMNGGK